MIVYGWNTFNLDSKKPSELGLPAEMDSQFIIQKKQKYFHLFWIPFFSLGQQWVIKKPKDKNLYEPSQAIHTHLYHLNIKHKTPWYTFTLPILAMAGGLLFIVFSSISDYYRKERHKEWMAQDYLEFKKGVEAGVPYTYYSGYYGDYKPLQLKVIQSDSKYLTLLASDTDGYTDDYEARFPQTFRKYASELDTIKVSKKEFLKAYNQKEESTFQGVKLNNTYADFKLNQYLTYTQPYFKKVESSYRNGEYRGALMNVGEDIEIQKIVSKPSTKNNLELDTVSMEKVLVVGIPFIVKGHYTDGEPNYTGYLIYKDQLNSIDTLELNVRGLEIFVNKR